MRTVTAVASVIATVALAAPAQAAESAHARHTEKVLRAKVIKLYGKRAPGCQLVRRRCKGIPNPNTAQIHRYFETLRRMVMPSRAAIYVRAGAPSQPPAGTQTIHAGGTLSAIAACESGGNPRAVSPTGAYRGKYQFDYGTWASIGGSGDPAAAPESVQDAMAAKLYAQRGAAPWPVCGR